MSKKAGVTGDRTGGGSRSPRPGPARKTAPQLEAPSLEPGAFDLIGGPRKSKPKGPPRPRLARHKVRSLWFQARAAWPMREAPVATLVRERRRARGALRSFPTKARWTGAGPVNIGGRLTSIVCDPAKPDRIWVGSAGGGVWSSEDAGMTWASQWYDQDSLNIGALAIDPGDPRHLYCGTGEANLSADSYAGVGLYETVDGGSSWRLLSPAGGTGLPRRIGAIAIDPFDSRHVLVGGIGFGETAQDDDFGGLYVSRDGGASFVREVFVAKGNYWCHAIVFDPKRKGTVYATFTARGAQSGIYRSTNGGRKWMQLRNGLPEPERFGRTSLAVSRSSPNVVYALAADVGSARADLVLGVFRSADRGDSWRNVAGDYFAQETQMSYGNTIAVAPDNSDVVVCGGVDLHLSSDQGRSWQHVTDWSRTRGESDYAHADHHCLLWPAAAARRIYDPNDGGLDVSEDGGRSWRNRSNGLAVTMFYNMDLAQSDARVYGGGAQDNGTVVTLEGAGDDFEEALGGDGGWIVFDPRVASHFFASFQNLNIFRFRSTGGSGPVTSQDVSPPADDAEKSSVWMCYIVMDPQRPSTVFTGSTRIWRTTDDGNSWQAVSQPLDGFAITAIEVARADSQRIYAGTEAGGVFRSDDGGDTWSANLSASLPGTIVTALVSSPADKDLVLAAIGNFGHSHLFQSQDGGRTWRDLDRGELPDAPLHSVVIPAKPAGRIYVSGDAGVFASQDGGTTWLDLTLNLPSVMVVDLAYREADRGLFVATYGRSIWRIKLA